MPAGEVLLGKMLGRFFFRHATATAVRDVSAHFRRVELRGSELRNVGWVPGDKVQVFIPDLGMRTYTPLEWHEERGTTELLLYAHGDGPGSRWGQRLAQGEPCQFFGPRRSVVLREEEPLFVFGDETSFAVAHALKNSRMAREGIQAAFEVSHRGESEDVLRGIGLENAVCIERAPEEAHLSAVCEAMRSAIQARPNTRLVLTGRAQSIQWIRARLKRDGMSPKSTVKAYWSVGKKGLD